MKHDYIIDQLCLLLEQQTYWGNINAWTEKDFKRLSAEIAKKSGITVSAPTLKRITGKTKTPDDYQPQEASLDGICIYLGYKSWDSFKQGTIQSNPEILSMHEENETKLRIKQKNKQKIPVYISITAACIALAAISYYIFDSWYKNQISLTDSTDAQKNVAFYAHSSIIDKVPGETAIISDITMFPEYPPPLNFLYVNGEIIPLYQHRLNKNKITITNYGIHRAKLYVNNKKISEVSILAPTPGWILDRKYFFPAQSAVIKDGYILNFNPASPEKKHSVEWFGETNINGNSCEFEIKFQAVETIPTGSENAIFYIHTRFNKIQLELIGPQSTVRPYIRLGDHTLHDLTERKKDFTQNIAGDHVLKGVIRPSSFTLLLDGNPFYTSKIPMGNMGEVLGLTFGSRKGLKVDYIKFSSGNTTFREDFND